MGPKIEPCGTTWVTVSGSDSDVAMRVHCCLLVLLLLLMFYIDQSSRKGQYLHDDTESRIYRPNLAQLPVREVAALWSIV